MGDGTYTEKYVKEKAPKAYVPPHQRGNPNYKPSFSFDPKPEGGAEEKKKDLSKSARKRQNKKKTPQMGNPQMGGLTPEQEDARKMAGYLTKPSNGATSPSNGASTEKEKKMKKIKKSLQAIEKLKLKQKNGAALEVNQIQKIATEDQLKAELEKLTLG